jgi:hypothetical protein
MQSMKFGLVAAAMVCALSTTAQAADCRTVAASGDNFTHDTAVLFSTNALKNTLAGQGRAWERGQCTRPAKQAR